ncbi:MAG: hypothetical protein IJI14_17600 [Anaerolineaceae bacterium]|nr:hypothetical protein [Anaerolineaceae bacterium]
MIKITDIRYYPGFEKPGILLGFLNNLFKKRRAPMLNYSDFDKKNLLLYFALGGMFIAMYFVMKEKDNFSDEIESQTSLSKSLLIGCISITTGIITASESLFGVFRRVFAQYRIPLYIGFCMLFVSFLCFFISFVSREGITNSSETEDIKRYLFRKKSLYNRIGIGLYIFSALYFFILVSITIFL